MWVFGCFSVGGGIFWPELHLIMYNIKELAALITPSNWSLNIPKGAKIWNHWLMRKRGEQSDGSRERIGLT